MNAPVNLDKLLPSVDQRHLDHLEEEAIFILREVAAAFERPGLLFSSGKDSCVVLHLAEKAFKRKLTGAGPSQAIQPPSGGGAAGALGQAASPGERPRFAGQLPFPLVHVDTGHNFPEVIQFRDERVAEMGERLVVGHLEDSIKRGTVRLAHPLESRNGHQTVTLLETIEEHRFDCMIGGARRDEEKARAKERICSFRDEFGQWDPKNQRPELWDTYNTRVHPGENIRVFPISNWTELDIWQYIEREQLHIPSIYYAHEREIIRRNGQLVPVSHLVQPKPGETVERISVRFRTVGDMTCTAPVESTACCVREIIEETAATRITERGATRLDDQTSEASMELRKKEGYF